MNKTIRAAIYARCATTDQQIASPLNAQVDQCIGFINSKGYKLTEIYKDESISGLTAERPGLIRMLFGAVAKNFDVVVVANLDRLSRNASQGLEIASNLSKHAVKLETIHKSPEEIFTETLTSGFANLEKMRRSQIQKYARRSKN